MDFYRLKLIPLLFFAFPLSCTPLKAIQPLFPVKIEGEASSIPGASIMIYSYFGDSYRLPLDNSKHFSKTFHPQTGQYKIAQLGAFFFEPGMKLVIKIKDGNISFSGTGSKENIMLREGRNKLNKIEAISRMEHPDHLQFFKVLRDSLTSYKNFIKESLNNNKTQISKSFYDLQLKSADCDEKYYLEKFLKSRLGGRAFSEQLPYLENKKLQSSIWSNFNQNDGPLYGFSESYQLLVDYFIDQRGIGERSRSISREFLKIKLIPQSFSNTQIKESLLFKKVSKIIGKAKTDDSLTKSTYNNFCKNVKNQHYIDEVSNIYRNLKKNKEGRPLPLFKFLNMNKADVTFQKFGARLIYIDVWATWCKPCLLERPHFERLAQLYKSDIAFLSISVDKNFQDWSKVISNEQLKTDQLLAKNAFESDFAQFFNISSIPRFIILDDHGNLINAYAKRPSDVNIETELKNLIKNKK
jgi:thiol-disulfide isomerase/thioredoxin